MTDSQLIQNYFNGHDESLNRLFNRYREKVYGFIFSKEKEHETSDDIYQEVCIKYIQNLTPQKYKDQQKFSAWIMRISYNLIMDHYRRLKRLPQCENLQQIEYLQSIKKQTQTKTAENELIRQEIILEIQNVLETLPKEQREVIKLRFYQQLSFKEISEETGVSINTALGRMRYGIMNLRKKIPSGFQA